MREEGKKDKERLSCCLYDFYFYFPVFLRAGNGKCLPLYIKKLRAYEAKEHLKKNKAIAPPPPHQLHTGRKQNRMCVRGICGRRDKISLLTSKNTAFPKLLF